MYTYISYITAVLFIDLGNLLSRVPTETYQPPAMQLVDLIIYCCIDRYDRAPKSQVSHAVSGDWY